MGTDIIHAFGNHPDWNETHFFNFYDGKNDICGTMMISLIPNRKMKTMSCHFMMPDGSVVSSRHKVGFDKADLEVRNLRFEPIIPEKSWRLAHTGTMTRTMGSKLRQSQVEMDLRFDCVNDVFDHRECTTSTDKEEDGEHALEQVEQFGRLTGTLSIGLDEFKIVALGGRYHSWGVREMAEMKSRKWLNCQFSDECALSVSKLMTDDSEIDAGFVFDGGKNFAITSARIDTDYHVGRKPRSFKLSLNDKEGQVYVITGRVVKNLELPAMNADDADGATAFMTLAKYDLGERTGFGIAEYTFR